MDVDELRKRKEKLESHLVYLINDEINKFVSETNVRISGIYIEKTDIEYIGEKKKTKITSVDISLDI